MDKLTETISEYSKRTFYQMGDYSQFTIDKIDEIEEEVTDDEIEKKEGEGLGSFRDFLGSIIYDVKNIIEVLKEGKDKELFQDLLNDLEAIETN